MSYSDSGPGKAKSLQGPYVSSKTSGGNPTILPVPQAENATPNISPNISLNRMTMHSIPDETTPFTIINTQSTPSVIEAGKTITLKPDANVFMPEVDNGEVFDVSNLCEPSLLIQTITPLNSNAGNFLPKYLAGARLNPNANCFIPSIYNATTEPTCGTCVLSTTRIVTEDSASPLELTSHCEMDKLNYVLATWLVTCVIVVILAFVCINNNNRKQASEVPTPKDLLRKLTPESPHKIIIGH